MLDVVAVVPEDGRWGHVHDNFEKRDVLEFVGAMGVAWGSLLSDLLL